MPATLLGTVRRFVVGDREPMEAVTVLREIGYEGPLSIEWEDSGMDRDWGAPDALAFVAKLHRAFEPRRTLELIAEIQRHMAELYRAGRRGASDMNGAGLVGTVPRWFY